MKNNLCIICSKNKGKRVCKKNNETLVCPICCAKIRNTDCTGCKYYSQTEQYTIERVKSLKYPSVPFIARIDPEVDDKVDRALEILERGNIARSEQIISALLDKNPDLHIVHYGMGVVYIFKKQYKEAIKHFDKAIEIFPYFAQAWYNKAVAHKKMLDVGESIRAFQKAIEFGNPEMDFVRNAKRFINDMEKHTQKTEGMSLEKHLELEEKFNKAFQYMQNKEWEKAIDGFKEVLAENPKHVQSYGNIGTCYGFLGERQKALDSFDKALELDPNYEPAILNRFVIESLKEGEKIPPMQSRSIEYYKDFSLKKKSLIQSILDSYKKK